VRRHALLLPADALTPADHSPVSQAGGSVRPPAPPTEEHPMPERSSYDHGTPCWVDLMAPDVDAAKAFYGGLFGWDATDEHDPDSGERIYTNFRKDGRIVAGCSQQMPGMEGMPPFWNTYIAVDDVDQIAKAVEAAGGTTMLPAMDVMEEGRMAVFGDPTGAAFSVWQAGRTHGAEVVNEPGAYSWNELMTRDLEAARSFYAEVFGWTYDDGMDMGPMGKYYVVEGGQDGGLAGMMGMPPDMPDQVPNHWGVYFTVADIDATLAKAAELGGSVVNGPMPSPVGQLATIHDDQHGSFSVLQPNPQS
jgi:predicted enzyme related to lactoylglutathione lyase